MKNLILTTIKVFDLDELQIVLNLTDQYGVSTYKGTFIVWDNDQDIRVIKFIDYLESRTMLDNILVVYEHEGSLDLVWRYVIPDEFDGRFKIHSPDWQSPDGDTWSINSSVLVKEALANTYDF